MEDQRPPFEEKDFAQDKTPEPSAPDRSVDKFSPVEMRLSSKGEEEKNGQQLALKDLQGSIGTFRSSPVAGGYDSEQRAFLARLEYLKNALELSQNSEKRAFEYLEKEKALTQNLNQDLQKMYDGKALAESQLAQREAENKELKIEMEAVRRVKLATEQNSIDNVLAQRKLMEIHAKASAAGNDFQLRLRRERDLRDQLVKEKEKQALRIDQLEKRLKEIQNDNDSLHLSLSSKEDSLLSLGDDIKMKDEIRAHRDSLLTENRSLRVQLEAARVKAETEARESGAKALLFLERVKTMYQDKQQSDKRIDELENELMQRDFTIKQLTLVKEECLIKIADLERRLKDDSSYRDRLRAEREEIKRLNDLIDKLQHENASLRDILAKLEFNNKEYYSKIKRLEEEILHLRILLNKKDTPPPPPPPPPPPAPKPDKQYVAVLGDDIDIALAEYINAQEPERQAKCFFFREGRGIYYYGTRRIFIKLEQGHLIVRVGGGYKNITDFIEVYSELEQGRLERRGSTSQLHGGMKVPTAQATPFLSAATTTTVIQKSPRSKSSDRGKRFYFN